jgi:hypothetical protein
MFNAWMRSSLIKAGTLRQITGFGLFCWPYADPADNRAKYLPQRRGMIQTWADYLNTLKAQRYLHKSFRKGGYIF